MGGTNNRFISRAERLSRARQERERREKTRKDAAAALQIQRVFRGRWVAKTVRDTFRALFDKRAGDLQKVSLILKATGKEFVPPLHVLSPLVQSFNFFHCYSPEQDRPRILLLCNFLWASFGAKDKRVNYRSLAGSAGCPSMPWVFQVSTFLRSALGLLVFTDNSGKVNQSTFHLNVGLKLKAEYVQKTEGCDIMMCGTNAHGKVRDALRNGGCALIFSWKNLKECNDGHGYTGMDGKWHKGKGPVTDRQVLLRGKK